MGLSDMPDFGRFTHVQGGGVPWMPLCGEIEMLDLRECRAGVGFDARVATILTTGWHEI